MQEFRTLLGLIGLGAAMVCWQPAGAVPPSDWPMLARDATRSGSTTVSLRPPFQRKWYRLFTDEGLMSGVQPVVAEGKVFLGTLAGTLYAIDADSGADAWVFRAGGALLHAAAAGEGMVFFGAADGAIYAVNANSGELAWKVETEAAIWNAPVIHDDLVVIGSRDGYLYAVDAGDGRLRWRGPTGGPILGSPAVDPQRGRVYVGSEDMHVYAFALADGAILWKSPKLSGMSFCGYHPVIAPDGAVMVTVQPLIGGDAFQDLVREIALAIFGDYASWRHSREENERLRAANFRQMEDPQTYRDQIGLIRRRLTEEPAGQSFFVLEPETGVPRFVAPIIYSESMNGPGMPPVVAPDGRVIVKYQALLRSRYEHYSPFLNPGYLDTATGHITPLMDQTRTYGWYDGLRMVHDEQCQWVVADRLLINTAQDAVLGLDLDTLAGLSQPLCRNIHEPEPGEALGILLRVLRGEELPPGKEWISRGAGVYGGGSVMAVPIAIAGDSFYYVPTHELNAGVALIAYRMQEGGTAAAERPAVTGTPSEEELRRIHTLPWDWDTLEAHRMVQVLQGLDEPAAGTLRRPLSDEAAHRAAALDEADLDRFIWEAREPSTAGAQAAHLQEALATHVQELISQTWAPLQMPAGKHPREAYRIFVEPTETLETLARAYPHLDEDLRAEVRRYVAAMAASGGPLAGPTGQTTFDPVAGENRSPYDLPPPERLQRSDGIVRSALARLYPFWQWAHVSGDWSHLKTHWPQLRGLADRQPNPIAEDCHNGQVAGLIAYCRIAQRLGDEEALALGLERARAALRSRLKYEWAHPRGGLMHLVPPGRTIFSRWRHLTPEVGRLAAEHAREVHEHLMEIYVDYHRPTWWLAWNIEYHWRNENPVVLPTAAADVFAARAWILDEPADALAGFLDVPWCRADLHYIQKLVWCLEAGQTTWHDVR